MRTRLSLDEFWKTAPHGRDGFEPDRIAHLPEPARRYLRHALAPGTTLARAVRLRMHGEIKLGNWLPFRAEQVIRWDRGMIWQATTRMAGLPIRGWDRLVDGEGAMRWKMLGILPVMRATGLDVTRSAAGRLMAETIWLPSVLCGDGAAWSAPEPSRFRVALTIAGERIESELAIDREGRLRSVRLERWGNPERGQFRYEEFGGLVEEECRFGGFAIPTRVRVGWYFGTDRFESHGEFFRVSIDDAVYR